MDEKAKRERWARGITNEHVNVNNVQLNEALAIWDGFTSALRVAIFLDIDAPSTQDALGRLTRVLGPEEVTNFIKMKLNVVHVVSGSRDNNG